MSSGSNTATATPSSDQAPPDRRENELIAAMLDSLSEGVVACDAEGHLIHFNRAARELHGRTLESVSSDEVAERYGLYLSDGRTPMRPEDIPLYRALRGEMICDVEMVVAPRDRAPRTLLASGQALYDADGRKLGAVVAMHDITERKRMEDELRTRERQFAEAQAVAHLGSWTWDLATDTITWSPEMYRIFGLPDDGRAFSLDEYLSLVHADDRDRVRDTLENGITTGSFSEECRIVRPTGEIRHKFSRGLVMRDAEGQPMRVLGTVLDITDRVRAEQALRKSKDQFQAVADLVPDLLWQNDANGRVTWYNHRWMEYTGQTLEQALGDGWLEAMHPDERQQVNDRFRMAVQSGQPLRSEHHIRRADGVYRWFLIQARPVTDPNGITQWFGAATDIDDQRERAESALLQSEERLRMVVEGITDYGIFMLDPAGRILTWNTGAERATGYRRDEAVGRHFSFLYLEEQREAGEAEDELREALQTGRAARASWRRRKDGTLYWNEEVVTALRTGGDLAGFVKITHDTTRRLQMEQSLRASEERYRLVLRATRDAVFDQDFETDVTIWGDALTDVFGYDDVSFRVGRNWWLERVHPDDRERVTHTFRDAASNGDERWSARYRFRRADGTYAHVMSRGFLVRDDTGKVSRLVGSITDITAQRETEQQLRAARDAAEAASRAKSEFLAGMSHELRTPLNAVIGFANVLRRNPANRLGPRELGPVERIRENGLHLLHLINGILDLAKVESGKMHVERHPVAVGTLLRETAAQLTSTGSVPIIVELPDTPVTGIEADKGRLRQVLINLIGNALKFTQRGHVTARLVVDPDTGKPARIDIIDTGVGIPAERLSAIFEPFEQVDNSTTRQYGGTGMGLAIARALCRAMGFDLTVQSELGVGSTFSVVFAPE